MKLQIGTVDATVGAAIDDVDTPALILDATMLEANIASMAKLFAGKTQFLRPHAKTHKSIAIAKMQLASGATGICCAKLGEAEALAVDSSINDIFITTPLSGRRKLERLERLARTVKLAVLVDDIAAIEALADVGAHADRIIEVLVEVDVGQQRCGTFPGPAAAHIADAIARNKHLRFKGLHGYQGKLQMMASYAERRAAVNSALERLFESARHCQRSGHDIEILTGGGSGSLAIDLALAGLNEIQPGSYVFMDANYRRIAWDEAGSSPPFESSLTILGSVVSRPTADRAVIDIGWKSASSDSGPPVPKLTELVFDFAGDEHGTIRRRDGKALNLALGEKVELVPSHCDTTVNLFSDYTMVRDGRLVGKLAIEARGRSQ